MILWCACNLIALWTREKLSTKPVDNCGGKFGGRGNFLCADMPSLACTKNRRFCNSLKSSNKYFRPVQNIENIKIFVTSFSGSSLKCTTPARGCTTCVIRHPEHPVSASPDAARHQRRAIVR